MFGSKKSNNTAASSSLDNDQKIKNSKIDTLLGRGTTIDGDIRFSGGLHIEGMIKGNLTADDKDAMLVLSEHGHIQGEVNVPNIVVNGTIDGDVYYNLLEMAVGSEVNGKLVRQKEDTSYGSSVGITEPEPS
jgi:cytoskeletal protein CcmA (bactofilin family)